MKRVEELLESWNINEATPAAEQAKKLGLAKIGVGLYGKPGTRKATHRVLRGKLVPVSLPPLKPGWKEDAKKETEGKSYEEVKKETVDKLFPGNWETGGIASHSKTLRDTTIRDLADKLEDAGFEVDRNKQQATKGGMKLVWEPDHYAKRAYGEDRVRIGMMKNR